MSNLEIRPVNKYDSVWDPKTMFTGFKVRVVLNKSNDIITNIQDMAQLRRRLTREIGEEGEDWILDENPKTDENELYLMSTGKLVMWKLQDNDKFTKLFAFVEQHTDNPQVIADWEQAEFEKKAAAAAAEMARRLGRTEEAEDDDSSL